MAFYDEDQFPPSIIVRIQTALVNFDRVFLHVRVLFPSKDVSRRISIKVVHTGLQAVYFVNCCRKIARFFCTGTRSEPINV